LDHDNSSSDEEGKFASWLRHPASWVRSAKSIAMRVWLALGHPSRMQIVLTPLGRKICIGCDLVEEIGLAVSLICEHLRILKEARLIHSEIMPPRFYNTLAPEAFAPLIAFLTRIQSSSALIKA
jgi:ArsR family transcriptional regulator